MIDSSPHATEAAWLGLLRCPSCRSGLRLDTVATPDGGRGTWGTLTCSCETYPLIDGIPILIPDRVSANTTGGPADSNTSTSTVIDPGPTLDDLVGWVTGDDPIRALQRLLNLSAVPWPLVKVGPVQKLHRSPATKGLRSWASRRRVRRVLDHRDDITVEEILAALYLYGPDGSDNYAYFTYRFAQPRQLGFLSLIEAMPPGRLVTVGCGLGNLEWHATNAGREVIGLDYNFVQLWVARWFVAPAARFICADATNRLPFDDDVAAATWFSDGIHYIPEAAPLMHEMRRCAVDGTVFLARFGNKEVLPPDAFEYSVAGWKSMLDELGPNRMVAESTLIDAYLAGRSADLTNDDDPHVLARAKWLSAVASDSPSLFTDHGPLPSPPPHARGTLRINPIYLPAGKDTRKLRLVFPSDWSRFEDAELTRYHAHQAALTPAQEAALGGHDPTGVLAPLVERFVVIGMPDRYYRTLKRRLKPRALQVMTNLFPRMMNIPDEATFPATRADDDHAA